MNRVQIRPTLIKVLYLIMIPNIIISCSRKVEDNNYKLEKYESGEIKAKYTVDENGCRKGKAYRYYKDGSLKQEANYINDSTISGELKTYHPNGKLNVKGFVINNIQDGLFYVYDSTGSLYRVQEYLNVEGKQTLNQSIDYKAGSVIEDKSFFMAVNDFNDTLVLDSTIKFHIYFHYYDYEYDSIKMNYGAIGEKFVATSDSIYKRVISNERGFYALFTPTKRGHDTLRYVFTAFLKGKETVAVYYFERDYFVE